MDYQTRLKKFKVEKNANCPNYKKAIAWAKENGYTLSKDISYNGYIYFERIIKFFTNSPLDVYKIELQVYDDIIKKSEPKFEMFVQEADFGQSILSPTTYRFKSIPVKGGYNSRNLDELFRLAINKETMLAESY